jgi:plastocyanin
MMRTSLSALAAATTVFAATTLVACGGGGGGTTEPNPPTPGPAPGPPVAAAAVSMESRSDGYGATDNSFSPASVRIVRGGTVTWHNGTGVAHTVTFGSTAGAPENVPSHTSGDNVRTFGTAGTYSYRCSIHEGMTGAVAVE